MNAGTVRSIIFHPPPLIFQWKDVGQSGADRATLWLDGQFTGSSEEFTFTGLLMMSVEVLGIGIVYRYVLLVRGK